MNTILHIGAHKTASTHVQMTLKRSSVALASAGIDYFGPERTRRKQDALRLPELLNDDGIEARSGRAHARGVFARSAGDLVISDENILGMAHGLRMIREGRFYPGAAQRLARLAETLPDRPLRLGLALRDPAGFLASAYCQRLCAGKFLTWDDFIAGTDPAGMLWSDLLARLRAVMPGLHWLVWTFEDYIRAPETLVPALLDRPGFPAVVKRKLEHPGLSAAAQASLMAEVAHGLLDPDDETAVKARAGTLRMDWSKDAGHAGFQPWSAEALARSREAYAQDLQRIAAQPGVRLWTPPPQ
jgi:hypothetical protein